jgi:hypothetical protein
MDGRLVPNWDSAFDTIIQAVGFLPEMKDQVENIRKEIIPQFNQIEKYIAELSPYKELFAGRDPLIQSLIHLIRNNINNLEMLKKHYYPIECIDWNKEKWEIESVYKKILAFKIDEDLLNVISSLKKQIDEALVKLSAAIKKFPDGILKNALSRGRESIKVDYLMDEIKFYNASKSKSDQAFENCKNLIKEYEQSLPEKSRGRSILAVTAEFPAVSSHYATTFSVEQKKEYPKEPKPSQPLQKPGEPLPDLTPQSFCRLM